jgi:hypothetical protein
VTLARTAPHATAAAAPVKHTHKHPAAKHEKPTPAATPSATATDVPEDATPAAVDPQQETGGARAPDAPATPTPVPATTPTAPVTNSPQPTPVPATPATSTPIPPAATGGTTAPPATAADATPPAG